MKKSQFNYLYKRKDDEYVIFNTYSKALITLDEAEYKMYMADEFSYDMKSVLFENRILIEDDFDEIHFLKYMHYKAVFSKLHLNLTIAPTLDCNFDCPYCYENRRAGKMSKEVQDALVGFVNERIDEGTKNISISWYGGEPLLCFDIVKELSQRVRFIADEKHCNVKMFLVTNGYLLTKEIVDSLDEIGIVRVQITIDGLPDHHNLSRPLRGGGGTFDTIWNNLKLFDDSPIEVIVRMNVDNNNFGDYQELRRRIKELDNPNISIYPSPTEDINKDKLNTISRFMSADEFDEFILNECKGRASGADEEFEIVDDRCCYCAAELENSYVIDDKGDFYKCWDEVGRVENRCFNILEKNSENYMILTRYLVDDVFEDNECVNCVFIPLCFGGCIFQKHKLGKKNCGFNNSIIETYIEQKYFNERR